MNNAAQYVQSVAVRCADASAKLAWRDKLRAMPPGRYVVAVGHYTCMEKGICRRCCAKKMAISLLARQRGISFFYYYAVTLATV